MTTDTAFRIMIFSRGIHNVLNVRRGTVGKWRFDLRKDETKISLDTKIKLLQRAGYTMRQDIRWLLPGQKQQPVEKIDWLTEFPSLTLIGRLAGMNDEQIKKVNKALLNDHEKLVRVYKQMF